MAVGKAICDAPIPVAGVRLGAVAAAVRYPDRLDIGLLHADTDCAIAAVFTRNQFAAAPVLHARQLLQNGSAPLGPWALLVNSGNANAATGALGDQRTRDTCTLAANALGVDPVRVLPFSTGVIGEQLPLEPFTNTVPGLAEHLRADGWEDFAKCIITTDTRHKIASRQVAIDGQQVTITGVAKGSGMMQPDMATMLTFAATDAQLDQGLLQRLHAQAVEQSFHRISIDGDSSTNDSALLLATGASGVVIDEGNVSVFFDALQQVYIQLARELVRDAEGATHCVALRIAGANTLQECKLAGFAIANSPLVKTAVFAEDPNWGRLVMALGRSGVQLDQRRVRIWLEDVPVLQDGCVAPDYTEAAAAEVMRREEYTVRIDLGLGGAVEAEFWFSDFSHEYIDINAQYRT